VKIVVWPKAKVIIVVRPEAEIFEPGWHRVPGNNEGGDPMGGVTPPPRGEGPPPTGGQRLK
jgi:hypothetical protein